MFPFIAEHGLRFSEAVDVSGTLLSSVLQASVFSGSQELEIAGLPEQDAIEILLPVSGQLVSAQQLQHLPLEDQ